MTFAQNYFFVRCCFVLNSENFIFSVRIGAHLEQIIIVINSPTVQNN